MGDPITATVLAVSAITGAGIQAHSANKASKRQQSAANEAARAMDKATQTSVVTTTNTAAPTSTTTAQQAETAVAKAARKRFSLSDTVNNFTPAGLRKTLG